MTDPEAALGGVAADEAREVLGRMVRIAAVDEVLREALTAGEVQASYYSPRGQEAIPAGYVGALRPDDHLVTTYRGLHDQVAKGVPLGPLVAEMLGRATGSGRGKGGPMHVAWPEAGLMLTTGVVGSGLPIAAGLALSSVLQGDGRVTVVCFGDGASNIGAFHEAMNLASLWSLPVVFVCQNNLYGEHTAFARHQRTARVADRAAAYAMPGVTVDGNDPLTVLHAARDAVGRARGGGGPTLLECLTYRLEGHAFGDPMGYLDPAELAAAREREPVVLFRRRMVDAGLVTGEAADRMHRDARAEARAALDAALAAPLPDGSEALTDVFAEMGR